jgi:hypothetical protein
MTFAEAIRLETGPQAFNCCYRTDPRHRVIATCALVGAYRRAGPTQGRLPTFMVMAQWAAETFPVAEQRTACPECGLPDCRVLNLVLHLNDQHRWARGRIANWVQGVEEGNGL